jgi:hypothetical protein
MMMHCVNSATMVSWKGHLSTSGCGKVEYGIPRQPRICGKCSRFGAIGSKGVLISTVYLGGEDSSGTWNARVFRVQETREGRGPRLASMSTVNMLNNALNLHRLILSATTTIEM